MAERPMPTPEPRSPRAFPSTGAWSDLLASLSDDGVRARRQAPRGIAMAPPGDPEESEEIVDEEDLDDEDDDLDDDEDDLDDDDDDDLDDVDDEDEVEGEKEA